MSILDLFLLRRRFLAAFEPQWERELLRSGTRQRRRGDPAASQRRSCTILILFQQSGYRTFKGFYTEHVQVHLRQEFPGLLSYPRFVALMPRYLVPLAIYLHTQLGECSGISFIDSTSLSVCHPARIHQHRVFRVDARRGKTSVGWFYGFKLHLVVNDRGELLALVPHSRQYRRPTASAPLGRGVSSANSLATKATSLLRSPSSLLLTQGLRLITKLRKNMRQQLLEFSDRLLLRKRALIETIIDQLKNISPDRALPPPQSVQFPRPPARGPHRLLPPAQEALIRPRCPSTPRWPYPKLDTVGELESVL